MNIKGPYNYPKEARKYYESLYGHYDPTKVIGTKLSNIRSELCRFGDYLKHHSIPLPIFEDVDEYLAKRVVYRNISERVANEVVGDLYAFVDYCHQNMKTILDGKFKNVTVKRSINGMCNHKPVPSFEEDFER